MKSLRIFIATLLAMAALDAACQVTAKGKIYSDETYYCLILEHYNDSTSKWNRWEIWEHYEEYSVKVWPYQKIEAMFIGTASGDTTLVTFYANGLQKRMRRDIELKGEPIVIGAFK